MAKYKDATLKLLFEQGKKSIDEICSALKLENTNQNNLKVTSIITELIIEKKVKSTSTRLLPEGCIEGLFDLTKEFRQKLTQQINCKKALEFLRNSGKTTEQIEKKLKLSNLDTIALMKNLMPKVDFNIVPTKHGYQARWYLVLPP